MNFEIIDIKDLSTHLGGMLESAFEFDSAELADSIKKLDTFIQKFRPDLVVGVESFYIDKLYRDAYYHYYSSKLKEYKRNCIRVSFFSTAISLSDFYSVQGAQKLQEHFMGFIIIRPTSPNIIGRNVLRPDIFVKNTIYHTSFARFGAAVNGIKLEVEGFPHSSQDAEFMVCAETTIWSLMEYFSNRYAEYKPVLPKTIHNVLSQLSMQRQVPSAGLTGLQISYALKEFGFGVKLYTANSYPGVELYRMIQMYVESGIPTIVAITNQNGIGHVMNIVGRTDLKIGGTFQYTPIEVFSNGSELYDYYEQPANYLVVDDNMAPYGVIPLSDPACNYTNPIWQNCTIAAAIVPLYFRIYMEADRARNVAIQLLKSHDQRAHLPSLVLRVLLSSSRTFKHTVSLNEELDLVVKTLIINIKMPKFVWIAEVGPPDLMADEKATGLILMDATEPKKPAILAYLLENSYIGPANGSSGQYSIPLSPFSIHKNLKPF
ncbi:hypothetical protein EXU57_14010 [Segetibacter sp. 3557_3]|uniref:hypothetical protein n=1 Tax=Segetibacter sp. 3557_3 TaxID=2547429 RepID=UPI001058E299|nr:hypothetical protein [Segetibacter sp. 3557_3]TDH25215.1 hypothetical protein EXU57_14010 [Segetibacter sp. 3557_3]